MANPNGIVENVEFAGFDADTLRYNEEIGFLQVTDESAAIDGLRLLGFGAPISRNGGFDLGETVQPLVDFSDLSPTDRTIDKQGKGVGPRMYNTPQAAHGLTDLPDTFGAFTFDVNPLKLKDTRQSEGNKLSRIGRHGLRMVKAKISNVEAVVADIHESYGDAESVLFTQPPRAEIRQTAERHMPNPDGVPAEFIIVRNALTVLHRVGIIRSK